MSLLQNSAEGIGASLSNNNKIDMHDPILLNTWENFMPFFYKGPMNDIIQGPT